MTEAEAIKEIKRWTSVLMSAGSQCVMETAEAQELAIKALENQIAKKPVGLHKNICPNCSWHIVGRNQRYCSDCGQKLNWDSEV